MQGPMHRFLRPFFNEVIRSALRLQAEHDRDRCLDFHRLSIQHGRAITPLPHRVESGLHEER